MDERVDTPVPLDLAAAVLWAVLAAAAVAAEAPAWLRIPLGLGLAGYMPGYAFLAALFPGRAPPSGPIPPTPRRGLQPLEWAALSLASSIAIVALVGAALNYSSIGLSVPSLLTAVALVTTIAAATALVRRSRLPPEEQFRISFGRRGGEPLRRSRFDVALAATLAISLVVGGGAAAYALSSPRPDQASTEFYVVGSGGLATCYPTTFHNGSFHATAREKCPSGAGNLTLGIANHEGERTAYQVRALWAPAEGAPQGPWGTWNVTLDPTPADLGLGGGFVPQHEFGVELPPPPGSGLWRLEFQLVLSHSAVSPHRTLHLWIESS